MDCWCRGQKSSHGAISMVVLQGHIPNLGTALEEAIARGCSGIISFGIAGGLASDLASGPWVVASGVVAAHKRYPTDREWARRLLQALGTAVHADIAGVDAPVVEPADKRRLHDATSSVAVDMESHIAAEAARAHGLPFAACRVIIDPAHRGLPPAALVNLRLDGTPDVAAVLRSVIRQPGQLPALLRVAADACAAQLALRAGRQRLRAGLAFPGFQPEPAYGGVESARCRRRETGFGRLMRIVITSLRTASRTCFVKSASIPAYPQGTKPAALPRSPTRGTTPGPSKDGSALGQSPARRSTRRSRQPV
jgi:adenosylhomocysteine nucleosidase